MQQIILKKLTPAFASRFPTLEISNPDINMRKEVINYLIKQINLDFDPEFNLDQEIIDKLARNTDQLSIRSIEAIINSLQQKCNSSISELIREERQKPIDELDAKEERKNEAKWQKIDRLYHGIIVGVSLAFTYLGYKLNLESHSFQFQQNYTNHLGS